MKKNAPAHLAPSVTALSASHLALIEGGAEDVLTTAGEWRFVLKPKESPTFTQSVGPEPFDAGRRAVNNLGKIVEDATKKS